MRYCENVFGYVRRKSREVTVGNVGMGGGNPIRVQSMLTADTRNTSACVREALGLAEAGCEIIRLTAQTKSYAANLEHIARELRAAGCHVPLVADIHFKPDAAMEAAKWVEKIRINPGNFVDKKRFEAYEYTEAEYAEELERVRDEFTPLVLFCKEHGRAMRLGANHGSLSDRIMSRYGDTPLGMVQSALEFAHVAHDLGYHDLVFSMKASNVKVMIAAYRLLVAHLDELGVGWNYPIHLGVTEAGEGEDGRIKSAIGIGSLLADGIGDTLRVSLTEDAVLEVPVAYALARPFQPGVKADDAVRLNEVEPSYNPFAFARRKPGIVMCYGVKMGWDAPPRVVVSQAQMDDLQPILPELGDVVPEVAYERLDAVEIDVSKLVEAETVQKLEQLKREEEPCVVTVSDDCSMEVVQAFRLLASVVENRHVILLKDAWRPLEEMPVEDALLTSSRNVGSLLCDGIGEAVLIQGVPDARDAVTLAYNILQAAGERITKAEYVSCPSCGRTLYNIQEATAKIRAATAHLKGVKIAVMGCIVNGPGEMADADFGYVGGAPDKINLYVGHQPVRINIPQDEAVTALVELIKEHGRWIDVQNP